MLIITGVSLPFWCSTANLDEICRALLQTAKAYHEQGWFWGFFSTIQCFQGAYLADTPVNSPCSSPTQLYLSHLICSAHTARLCFSPQVSKGSVVNRLFITQLFPVIGDITGCRSHIVLLHLSIELRYCQITANFF